MRILGHLKDITFQKLALLPSTGKTIQLNQLGSIGKDNLGTEIRPN
jgi:hypothetical protein